MSDILIKKIVIDDLFAGRADYIKKNKMFYNNIYFDNKEIVFGKGKKQLATVKLPGDFNFSNGDTVTINFESSMPIYLKPAK
jgi:hypothetical protein